MRALSTIDWQGKLSVQTGLIQWTYSVWVNHSYNDHCIFSPTIIIFSAVERKPGSLSSNNGIPTVRFFWTLLIKKKSERERKEKQKLALY